MVRQGLSRLVTGMVAAALLAAACSPSAAPAGGGSAPSGGSAPAAGQPQPAAAENAVDKVALDKAKPTEILFWHRQTGPSEEVQNKLIDEFNKSNEWGIKVKAESLGDYTKLYQKILAAIQAKSVPDFAAAYESMSAEYYEAQAIVPFDDYIASKKYGLSDAELKDLVPSYMEATKFPQYDNKRLTFPYTKSTLVMYTNTQVLKNLGIDKPAANWDDFVNHCRKAVAAIGKCYALSVDTSTADAITFSNGGEVISKDGKTAWGSPEALKTLKLYETLTKENLAHQIKGNDDQSDIASGKALYMLRSSTSIPFTLNLLKDQGKDRSTLGITMIPQGQAAGKDPQTVLFGGNVSIFKTTPEKQLASWLFIKWLSAKEQTNRWNLDGSNGYFPLRLSALAEPTAKKFFDDNPHFAAAFEASKYGKAEPSNKGWQEVRTFVDEAVTGIITGKLTAEAAQKQIMDKSQKALAP